MKADSVNVNSGAFWNGVPTAPRGERVDFTRSVKPANADKFVLNLPVSEVVYKRQEFTADERMGEGCAFCSTYMERTLLFADGSGLSLMSDRSGGGHFIINADKSEMTFGKSGANMNDISHAVEETWERIDRSMSQVSVSGSLSGTVSANGSVVGGSVGLEVQSTVYKYSSARETVGTVLYKNGGAGSYRETALSSREIYNKCAVFLAEAFGEKSTDLTLDEKEFNELFDGADKEKSLQERQSRLDILKSFMERNLAAVRKKSPKCGSLKAFEDAYRTFSTYKYSDIASIAEKMFSADIEM